MKCYFFGTFNPIHKGHTQMASQIREKLDFDSIIFVPAFNPPHKIPNCTFYDRLMMAKLALGDENVSDIELKLPTPSFSYRTIKELKKQDKSDKINFIIGYDAFAKIESWKMPQELKEDTKFIVIPRKYDGKLLNPFEHLKQRGWDFQIVEADFIDISSNEIRNKVEKDESIEGLVDKKVEEYIYEHGLYKKQAQRVS